MVSRLVELPKLQPFHVYTTAYIRGAPYGAASFVLLCRSLQTSVVHEWEPFLFVLRASVLTERYFRQRSQQWNKGTEEMMATNIVLTMIYFLLELVSVEVCFVALLYTRRQL